MKYRFLKTGEKIRQTDRFHSSIDGTWMTFKKFYGDEWFRLGYDKNPPRKTNGMVSVMRKVK